MITTYDKQIWAETNIQVAEAAIKRVLKDSDSAEFRDVGVVVPKKLVANRPGVVCGYVNSKNSFGAYAGFTEFVVIAGVPIINEHSPAFRHLWNKECANKPQW